MFNEEYSASIYNGVALPPSQVGVANLFDYAPDASVKLVAGKAKIQRSFATAKHDSNMSLEKDLPLFGIKKYGNL